MKKRPIQALHLLFLTVFHTLPCVQRAFFTRQRVVSVWLFASWTGNKNVPSATITLDESPVL
jgi:hypothetical protein